MTYCRECSYLMTPLIFYGPNGLCLWDYCTYCGIWERVCE